MSLLIHNDPSVQTMDDLFVQKSIDPFVHNCLSFVQNDL